MSVQGEYGDKYGLETKADEGEKRSTGRSYAWWAGHLAEMLRSVVMIPPVMTDSVYEMYLQHGREALAEFDQWKGSV